MCEGPSAPADAYEHASLVAAVMIEVQQGMCMVEFKLTKKAGGWHLLAFCAALSRQWRWSGCLGVRRPKPEAVKAAQAQLKAQFLEIARQQEAAASKLVRDLEETNV